MTTWCPRHLSASAIAQYTRCPAGYFRRYVLQEVTPAGAEMRFGRSVHKGLEAHHRGADPFAAFLTDWEQMCGEMDAEQAPYDDLSAEGLALLKLYRADPLPAGHPELWVSTPLPGLDVPAVGFLDLHWDMSIGEHKTTGNPFAWSQARADKEFAAAWYSAVWRAMTGHLPDAVVYTILCYRPRPTLTRYRVVPTDELADAAIRTGVAVLAAIDAGAWEIRCRVEACGYRDLGVCGERLASTLAGTHPEPKQRAPRVASGPVLVGEIE